MSVSAQDIVELNDQCGELIRRVARGITPLPMAVAAVQAAIESRYQPTGAALYYERFNPAEVLLADFRGHNQELALGFDSERIDVLAGSVPEFSWNDPLVTLFIYWTLDDLATSADAKLKLMRHVFGQNKVFVSSSFRTDAEHLYLPEGAPAFQPFALEWGVIDLGRSVRNTPPNQVDPSIAAGLQVFDASTQHPKHTLSHNGRDIPYLDVPGLRAKVPGDSWPFAPCIDGDSDGGVSVHVLHADDAAPYWAEPVLVSES